MVTCHFLVFLFIAMDIETVREYCLAKPGTSEDLPFDDVSLVFKVMGKMFGILSLDEEPLSMNLKCDPERALKLRESYPGIVRPGYHMNKKHWNTVELGTELPPELATELIDHSYDLVVAKMTKKMRKQLEEL